VAGGHERHFLLAQLQRSIEPLGRTGKVEVDEVFMPGAGLRMKWD